MNDWRIYRGVGQPHDGVQRLPEPPPWRDFTRAHGEASSGSQDPSGARRLGVLRRRVENYAPRPAEVDAVNAALYLRRPLLVTGNPGTGKSTLAYAVAHELKLGRVLRWPIVSRTTLQDGLYRYDAIGRLQDVQLERARHAGDEGGAGRDRGDAGAADDRDPGIGAYIRLGPLGTALLPSELPRVLLIDELDKSDIDLPNDLLHVLENGSYDVPELVRDAADTARVHTSDPSGQALVRSGRVECREFPVVVITSNGEREFPAAFRRRCLPLELRIPGREQLLALVEGHLGVRPEGTELLVDEFLGRIRSGGTHSLDQLLNAVQMTTAGGFQAHGDGRKLVEMLLRDLAKGR